MGIGNINIKDYYDFMHSWWEKQSEFPRELRIRLYDYFQENDEVSVTVWPHSVFCTRHILYINPKYSGIHSIPLCIISEQLTLDVAFRLGRALSTVERWHGLEYKEGLAFITQLYLIAVDFPRIRKGLPSILSWKSWYDFERDDVSYFEKDMENPRSNLKLLLDFFDDASFLIYPDRIKTPRAPLKYITFLSIPPTYKDYNVSGKVPYYVKPELIPLIENLQALPKISEQLNHVLSSTKFLINVRKETSGKAELEQYVFRQESDFWTIVYNGHKINVKDMKGLHYICYLLKNPGKEIHAHDLVIATGNVLGEEDSVIKKVSKGEFSVLKSEFTSLDSPIELLDKKGIDDCKKRISELETKITEAKGYGRNDIAKKYLEEKEKIEMFLKKSIGLRGKSRRAISIKECSRLLVKKTIKTSLENIYKYNEQLGQYLSNKIKTGTFCSYNPDPDHPIFWQF